MRVDCWPSMSEVLVAAAVMVAGLLEEICVRAWERVLRCKFMTIVALEALV